MELIHTADGHAVEAKFIKKYTCGKLFFLNENLIITDLKNKEITHMSISSFIQQIL